MNTWEVLFCVLLLLAVCTICFRPATNRKQFIATLLGLLILASVFAITRQDRSPTLRLIGQVPQQVNNEDFISSQTCRSCHPQQHASWHQTYHRTMTQLGLPEAIVPSKDFEENRQLTSGSVTVTLKRIGDEFWVNTPDPDEEYRLLENEIDARKAPHVPRLVDRQIVLVTGSHTMQIFWLPSEKKDAPLRLFPWVYQIREQRWMPYEDSFVVHPDFGRPAASWDNNCIACHTVNGEINMLSPAPNPRIKSTVAEYGISCEACHGPGREHVKKHQNPLARYQQHLDPINDRSIVNPAKLTHAMGSQVCGQCHSSFDSYKPYRAGKNVNQARHFVRHADAQDPNLPFYDNYWKDGSIRIGGREYLGLTESPCYLRGKMSCMSCHSMHKSDPNDQLAQKMDTNHACLQCHQEMTNRITEHTYHPADSEGSRCYNCHMPHTSYALLGAIRNHRITSPNAINHAKTGHPNACNLCHLDKTLQWTSEYLTEWYNQPPLKLDATQQSVAAAPHMMLTGDAVQRIVIAWHMGWEPALKASGKNWQSPLLAQLLQDPYSAVRFVAHKSLQKLPGYKNFQGSKPYDFIAPEKERQQFQDGFLQRLRAAPNKAPAHPETVLWKADGTLQMDQILKLLKQRDDRRILLAE